MLCLKVPIVQAKRFHFNHIITHITIQRTVVFRPGFNFSLVRMQFVYAQMHYPHLPKHLKKIVYASFKLVLTSTFFSRIFEETQPFGYFQRVLFCGPITYATQSRIGSPEIKLMSQGQQMRMFFFFNLKPSVNVETQQNRQRRERPHRQSAVNNIYFTNELVFSMFGNIWYIYF